MLLDLWACWGNVGLGTLSGGAFAIAVMTDWYTGAYRDDAWGWVIWVAHVVIALWGGLFVGVRMYRFGERRVEEYDAEVLYDRWIQKRLNKELARARRGA